MAENTSTTCYKCSIRRLNLRTKHTGPYNIRHQLQGLVRGAGMCLAVGEICTLGRYVRVHVRVSVDDDMSGRCASRSRVATAVVGAMGGFLARVDDTSGRAAKSRVVTAGTAIWVYIHGMLVLYVSMRVRPRTAIAQLRVRAGRQNEPRQMLRSKDEWRGVL